MLFLIFFDFAIEFLDLLDSTIDAGKPKKNLSKGRSLGW